ncbi:MAG: UDP-N-acetylglucosamine 2-epimerase (non-hydrolyzing) [Oscillospiraceae bacterium]|jgi:UDP-N-acetylglucosamine 2-epimerase|nr:UDP-N-acetylglucosamine 2-epimerase (non-hydrolyzing) [Oscillospiraceae bacterium]
MENIKVMTVFGTRPEAIKMAPLVLELEKREGVDSIVCVTAQHREMLDSVLEIFGISPDYDLNIMKKSQSLSSITSGVLLGIDGVLKEAKPDMVLVHGDTSTTFAGALSAFYHQIPVGHVEAGLRTYDLYSPFPEEANRRLVSELSCLNFAPTRSNADNLRRENVFGKTVVTGNTAIDALKFTIRPDFKFYTKELLDIDFEKERIILVTAHRRENYGEPLENIMNALKAIAESHSDTTVIYPVHLSPVVTETAGRILGGIPNVKLTPPLNTDEMHNLMSRCYMVMTDSGGLQEEAPALGKPVLCMRRETERPEAVDAGTVKLCGVEKEVIVSMANELLDDPAAYGKMARAVNPYGDGEASRRICGAILHHFGRGGETDEFQG